MLVRSSQAKVNELYAFRHCGFRGRTHAFAFSDAFNLNSDLRFALLALFEHYFDRYDRCLMLGLSLDLVFRAILVSWFPKPSDLVS